MLLFKSFGLTLNALFESNKTFKYCLCFGVSLMSDFLFLRGWSVTHIQNIQVCKLTLNPTAKPLLETATEDVLQKRCS